MKHPFVNMTIELIGPALMVCSHIFMSLGIAMHWTGSGDLVDASSAIKQNHQTLLLPTVTLILIQTLSIRQKQANVKHCQPPPESHMMFSSSRQITGSQIFLLKWEEVGGLCAVELGIIIQLSGEWKTNDYDTGWQFILGFVTLLNV